MQADAPPDRPKKPKKSEREIYNDSDLEEVPESSKKAIAAQTHTPSVPPRPVTKKISLFLVLPINFWLISYFAQLPQTRRDHRRPPSRFSQQDPDGRYSCPSEVGEALGLARQRPRLL